MPARAVGETGKQNFGRPARKGDAQRPVELIWIWVWNKILVRARARAPRLLDIDECVVEWNGECAFGSYSTPRTRLLVAVQLFLAHYYLRCRCAIRDCINGTREPRATQHSRASLRVRAAS